VIPEDDLGPQWLRDSKSINIEIDSVRHLAEALRQNLDENFRTHLPRVYGAIQPGAQVGNSVASHELVALREKLAQCLESTKNLVRAYDQGTNALAQAAKLIADRYGTADGLASDSAAAVTSVITPQAQRVVPADGRD
jgi:hypothetical protein